MRRDRCHLRRLDDHPVAGSNGGGKCAHGENQRIVPGGDDKHDTLGLPVNAIASRPEQDRAGPPLGPHPAINIDERIADQRERRHDFHHACLVVGSPAEVLRDRLAEFLRPLVEHVAQAAQQRLAFSYSRRRIVAARLVHAPEAPLDLFNAVVVRRLGKALLAHDEPPVTRCAEPYNGYPAPSVQQCARRT